ncbi:hypothetical protein BFJ68_g18655 [Fusarium oxysporum]|nr:hypothetical protein BFJ68_g18655 [Fusarium oxysporum]
MPPLQTASKEKSADAFSRWVESLDPLTSALNKSSQVKPEL